MSTLALLLLLAADPAYVRSLEQFRAAREAELKKPDGWLAVAGLFWLDEGDAAAGADPKSAIVLPAPAPAKLGVFTLRGREVRFRAAAPNLATLRDQPVAETVLRHDPPDPLRIGPLTLFVIKRGDRYALRLRDTNSEMRRNFRALTWFPADEQFRIRGRWIAYPEPKVLSISNILGQTTPTKTPGEAVVTIGGVEYRMNPIPDDGRLQFVFKDQTSGKQTYGAARFLYVPIPQGDTIELDFNRAENPPCAFTPYATCPLPPPQNRVRAPITAGEKNYGDH